MHSSDYLRSDLLTRAGFLHAFFTRRGGVSAGAYGSLNASPEVGDHAEHVTENLRRIAHLLGVPAAHVCVPRQVHGAGVLVLDGPEGSSAAESTPADAIVAGVPGLACAVRTADCVPILMADRESRHVAAVHAGWRGVVQQIVQATVDVMLELGSSPASLVAVIGPHISSSAFEVGDDVARELERASRAEAAIHCAPGQKPRADLAKILTAQLSAAGLTRENVERIPGCTYGDEAAFFSYRRDGQRSGRMLAAIVAETPIRNDRARSSERRTPGQNGQRRAP